jgi:hypothetical protein
MVGEEKGEKKVSTKPIQTTECLIRGADHEAVACAHQLRVNDETHFPKVSGG